MSGNLHPPGTGADEPGIDPCLRAALDHAPDGELRPPPAVRAAVLAVAHGTHRLAAAPTSGWRRWWAAALAPRTLATAASVACVGIALKLAWPEPEWLAEPAGARPEAAASALRHDEVAAEAARQAPPPAPPQARSAAPAEDSVAEAPSPPATAAPAPAPRARAPEARETSRDMDRRSLERAPAPVPAPITSTTTAHAPAEAPPQPAPPPAPPPPAPTIGAAAPAAPLLPRSESAAPVEQRAAAKALSQDAQAQARRGLVAEVAPASVASKPAPPPGHPSALARWAQALAVPTDVTAQPPAGWQLRHGGEAVAWRPAHRAWWQALLAGSAGRWTLAPATPGPGDTGRDTWQLQAPDGPAFSLRVEHGQLWLQAEGGTWRAPRPEGLPDAP